MNVTHNISASKLPAWTPQNLKAPTTITEALPQNQESFSWNSSEVPPSLLQPQITQFVSVPAANDEQASETPTQRPLSPNDLLVVLAEGPEVLQVTGQPVNFAHPIAFDQPLAPSAEWIISEQAEQAKSEQKIASIYADLWSSVGKSHAQQHTILMEAAKYSGDLLSQSSTEQSKTYGNHSESYLKQVLNPPPPEDC